MKLQLVNIVSLAALPLLTTAKLLSDGKLTTGVVGVAQLRQPDTRSRTSPAKRSPQDFDYNTYFEAQMAAANTPDEVWCGSTTHKPCPGGLDFCCPAMTYCIDANAQFGITEPRCVQCPNPGPETEVCWDGMTCCAAGGCTTTKGECLTPPKGASEFSSGSSSDDDEVSEDVVEDVPDDDDNEAGTEGKDAKGSDAKATNDATNTGTDAGETNTKGAGATKGANANEGGEDAESAAVREAGKAGWQVAAVVGIVGYNVLA